jgi:hypothetical protein
MQETLDGCIMERISRLKQYCSQLKTFQDKGLSKNKDKEASADQNYENTLVKMNLAEKIFDLEFKNNELKEEGESFVKIIEKKINRNGKRYVHVIKDLDPDEQNQGSTWLLHIEQRMLEKLLIGQG